MAHCCGKSRYAGLFTGVISRAVLVVLFAASGAPAGVAGVVGEDDRRRPGEADHDLIQSLGLVVCRQGGRAQRRRSIGTGTLVGNTSTVLTVAHNFIDDRNGSAPAIQFDPVEDCSFRQYDETGELRAEVGFVRSQVGDYWSNRGRPNQDWAVLRTTRALPDSSVALSFVTQEDLPQGLAGESVRVVAFHADRRDRRRLPLLSEGQVLGVNYGGYDRLAHTADMGRMSSGGALVIRSKSGRNLVIGIHRSSASFGEFNLAVPVSSELEQALRAYAWGQTPVAVETLAWQSAMGGSPTAGINRIPLLISDEFRGETP